MEAEFYYNSIFIGIVNDVSIQIAMKDFVCAGPKAVVQFFCSKTVVEQWFITKTLNEITPNRIVLKVSNNKIYRIKIIKLVTPIPLIDSNLWKFKLRIQYGDSINVLKEVV